jgi:hypothetical protein
MVLRRWTMKYCEDCKWSKLIGSIVAEYTECSNEAAFYSGEFFVTRRELPKAKFCREWGKCNFSGTLWEAKDA